MPDVNIYIQSILPVNPEVQKEKPLLTNEKIDNFNESLTEFAKEKEINYIDLGPIIDENEDLLEPDGIHVKYKIYKLWLNYLVENIK